MARCFPEIHLEANRFLSSEAKMKGTWPWTGKRPTRLPSAEALGWGKQGGQAGSLWPVSSGWTLQSQAREQKTGGAACGLTTVGLGGWGLPGSEVRTPKFTIMSSLYPLTPDE